MAGNVGGRFATSRFRTNCTRYADKLHGRILAYRDLGIEFSAQINPYTGICKSGSVPDELGVWFPGATYVVVQNEANVTLDLIDDTVAPSNTDPTFLIAKYSAIGLESFQKRDYEKALRAYLNVRRCCNPSDSVDPIVRKNIGIVLAELGDFLQAANYWVIAAESFQRDKNLTEAADCLECAGLAWEAAADDERRPGLVTSLAEYNSTECFRDAKALYASCGNYDSVSRVFISERDAHRRWTWSSSRKAELGLLRFVCLYGESPKRAIRSMVLTWFLFAFLFLFAGIERNGYTIDYDFAWNGTLIPPLEFLDALYFSVVTMSTLGYGDYAPAAGFSQMLAGMEAILGMILVATLLVTVQRRYVGR